MWPWATTALCGKGNFSFTSIVNFLWYSQNFTVNYFWRRVLHLFTKGSAPCEGSRVGVSSYKPEQIECLVLVVWPRSLHNAIACVDFICRDIRSALWTWIVVCLTKISVTPPGNFPYVPFSPNTKATRFQLQPQLRLPLRWEKASSASLGSVISLRKKRLFDRE